MGRNSKRKKDVFNDQRKPRNRDQSRVPYDAHTTENAAFESFYKQQNIVKEEEWPMFIHTLREPLPAAFRVTGSKNQADQLLNFIKSNFFKNLDVDADGTEIKPPLCLQWYPNNLAWQLEYSRVAIRSNDTLKKLHSFLVSESESGNISRQEAVSMIPPLLMDIKPHHKILDMCAAPGSKTSQMIEYLHADCQEAMPEGFVVGNDVDNRRCYLMVHQVKRLQSPNLMIINHDATRLPNMYLTTESGDKQQVQYDRILCDVPCSGDGTLRKNPEVWRKWTAGHGMNLHNLQFRVLGRGLELLSIGGKLVYSTCSFNPLENEAVIAAMLKKCEGSVHLVDCSSSLPELKRSPGVSTWKIIANDGTCYNDPSEVTRAKAGFIHTTMFPPENILELNLHRCMRILPHHQNTGGFFIAVLEKTSTLPWMKQEKEVEPGEQNAELDAPPPDVQQSKIPPAKKIKYAGYREEPFYYLSKDDATWPSIKKFYDIDDSFDQSQLMVRSLESEKKRNIYLSSKSMKNLAQTNEGQIKYINTGVKILARSEHVLCDISYRLVQDGLPCLDQHIRARRLDIEKQDVIELLTQENPFFSRLQPKTQDAITKMDVGGLVLTYRHVDECGVAADLTMAAWRGKTSCRVYVPKFERHHYLRMCGVDPDEVAVDWVIKDDQEGPKDGEENNDRVTLDNENGAGEVSVGSEGEDEVQRAVCGSFNAVQERNELSPGAAGNIEDGNGVKL